MPSKKAIEKPVYYADGKPDDTTTLYFDRQEDGSIRSLGLACTEDEARQRSKDPMSMVVSPAQLDLLIKNEILCRLGAQPSVSPEQATALREAALFKVELNTSFMILNRQEFEAYQEFVATQPQ